MDCGLPTRLNVGPEAPRRRSLPRFGSGSPTLSRLRAGAPRRSARDVGDGLAGGCERPGGLARFRHAYPVRGMLRSRANTIEGGTTEVNKTVIAERALGLPREPDPWSGEPWSGKPWSEVSRG